MLMLYVNHSLKRINILPSTVSVCLLAFFLLSLPTIGQAQQYDLLLDNGHVIDPKNNINEVMDVAIADGKVAEVADNISASESEKVVDVSGLYVTPGLIDIHVHVFYGTQPHSYLSNGFVAVAPDGFTFPHGVTTVVDAGGSGWRNFRQFKEQVINRSKTRVLALLNIVGHGMKGGAIEQNMDDMDPKMTALVANRYPETIVGIKIAHYRGHTWEPFRRAVQAGEMADIPVMVDFGSADPPLSLSTLLLEILRPGDIYTHMYGGGGGGRQAVVNREGELREGMLEAQQRGIIFDVGHGGGSFYYTVAVPATKQELWPNTISTDLHKGSMNAGMKSMLNVVSKMMNMGMSLQEVIEASTWTPAQVIQREDLGHLSEGAVADVAVFDLLKGDFGFVGARGFRMPGDQKLETELTIRAGEVVYDLNGLAAPLWNK